MSLRELPVLVLEEIFQHLDLKDMMNAWEAVGGDGSEGFWAKICKREGYTRMEGFDDDWRSIVTYNMNWRANKSVIREYVLGTTKILKNPISKYLHQDPDLDSDSNILFSFEDQCLYLENDSDSNSDSCLVGTLLGENLFLCDSDEVKVFNLTSTPVEFQKLPLVPRDWQVCGSKLLISADDSWMVYAMEKDQYHKVFEAKHDIIISPKALSNEYFAYVHDSRSRVRVVNLSTYKEINNILPYRYIDEISLAGVILNIVRHKDSVYVIERFDLREEVYLDNLVLLKDDNELYFQFDMGSSAQLLVYSLYNSFDDITSPLSIWRSNGEFLAKLPRDEEPLHIKTFHRILVEGEYIIFSTLPKYLTIWTSRSPTSPPKRLKIEMTENMLTVLNSLLILVYSKGFKVIDYQKATFLYKVDFKDHIDEGNNCKVFANQYYLAVVQQMEVENEKQRESKSKIRHTEEAASTSDDCEAEYEQRRIELKTTLVIYDFTSCV